MSFVFLAVACGSQSSTPTATPNVANQPAAGLTGITPPANSLWSSQDYIWATTTCAQTGAQQTTGTTAQQWAVFCGCVYSQVAVAMTLSQFQNNFTGVYNQLSSGNPSAIQTCATRANLTSYMQGSGSSGTMRSDESSLGSIL